MPEFIPPAKPIIGAEERAAVDRVLRSGMLAQGPEVAAFEVEFAEHLGLGRACVAVNSGTSGLHLGLLSAGYAARTYALGVGLLYIVLAIWGFLETEDGFGVLIDLVPINTEDNFLHLILGLTGIGAGLATPADTPSEPAAAT